MIKLTCKEIDIKFMRQVGEFKKLSGYLWVSHAQLQELIKSMDRFLRVNDLEITIDSTIYKFDWILLSPRYVVGIFNPEIDDLMLEIIDGHALTITNTGLN